MKTQARIGLAVGLALALFAGLAPRTAAAAYQMPITFGGYTNRSETLTNFPVLVVFSNGVGSSGFSFASMPFATTNGYDLRFRDASGASLTYEIESWNTNSACYVWVQVPTIATNGSTSITATWGDASRSYQMPYTTNGAVWANGYQAVWHLKDGTTLGTVRDSTTNGYTASINGGVNAVTGRVDGAADFDGVNGSYLNTTFNPQATLGNNLTIRALVYPRATGNYRGVAGDHNSFKGLIFLQYDSSPAWNCSAGLGTGWASGSELSLALNAWNDVSAVYQNSGGNEIITAYKDGVAQTAGSAAGNISHLTTFTIGRAYQDNNTRSFNGIVDELRVSRVARSADWVWAEYANMVSNTLFGTYGAAGAASSTTYQLPIAFTNYTRAETLSNFPVLVVLTNGLGGLFNYDQFTAPGNGGDLRFTDSTGSTLLDFEFEKWNNTGASYVWVRVPQLSSNTTIYAKWGGSDTNLPASTTNGAVWDANYKMVWHLSEGVATTPYDATTNRLAGTVSAGVTQNSAGQVAAGCAFNGASGTKFTASAAGLPSGSGARTMSTWFKLASTGQDQKEFGGWGANNTDQRFGWWLTTGALGIEDCGYGYTFSWTQDTQWHHVSVTLPNGGTLGQCNFSLDGVPMTASGTSRTLNTGTTEFKISGLAGNTSGYEFSGNVDEWRISNIARSTNWVWAEYANMASNSFFNGYGTLQATASGLITLQPVGNLTTNSAQLIATLSGLSADLYAFWDTQDRGTNFTWAYTNSPLNAFANTAAGATITNTATGLMPGTSYAYRFYGTNTTTGWSGWSAAGSFTSAPAAYPPQIQSQAPTGVLTNGATFNGYLITNGSENAAVYVAWGQTNGAVSGSWAATNWWNPGAWTNGSYPSTNMALSANADYYYTFGATNSTTNVTASGYQYLITGAVTVQPTDPTGRVTLADTAAFTVYRPASCTNAAITVAYTLGGTATNGVNYTNSPAVSGTNGTVTIAAGQTSATVTVWPLNVAAPQQTVVLTLVSSNYPVGTASSATCTLAAVGVAYNDIANGNWNSTSTWSPTGYPGGGDTAVIDSQTVTANISLTNSTAPATITVATNGTVAHASGVVVASPVTMAGGTWAQADVGPSAALRLTGPVSVTTNSLFTAKRNANGIWLDGSVSGTGRLTFRGLDSWPFQEPSFYITAASNTHSGGMVVEGNSVSLVAVTNQSLGTGDITVNADAYLVFQRTQDYTGAPRTPVVTLATTTSVLRFTTTDNMTLPFGLVAQGAGKVTTEAWRLGEVWSGAVTLNTNLTLAAVRASGGGTSIVLSGLVSGPGGIVVNADDYGGNNNEQGVVELRRGTNTYTGGTTVRYGRLKVSADGALGTGPVTVYNRLLNPSFALRTSLQLDATPDMNWALSNSIAGEGTIVVEGGTGSYRLTETGTVSPGTNASAVAVLTVNGKFAFAQNGGAPATLAIDVASVGTVAGTNHDQLAIAYGDATLAASITNCALAISRIPTPTSLIGTTVTVVNATGADFAPYQFASVSTNIGVGGRVIYTNGLIALTWEPVTGAPSLQNRPATGVTTNGATFNAYLVTNGYDAASVYVLWGGNTNAWTTTNTWAYGAWTNGSYPSTNMALPQANANYYYSFGAVNSASNVVATPPQYLITGEVTVQPTDPTGRVTLVDTAAFTVYRPASCTNDALTVAYTLGGTATNGTHYTNSPAATGTNGTVTIAAGQTNAVVTVWPLNVTAPQQTVVLTLVSSNYPVGAASSATCTLAAISAVYNDAANGNWNSTSTWSPTGYPGGGDTAVIDSHTVTANISLTNSAAPASITVATGGTVSHGDGVVVASPVTLAGGTWAQGVLNPGSAMRLTGAVTVTTNSLFTGGRGYTGIWLDGPVSGTKGLTFRGVDYYSSPPQPPDGAEFYLTAASNTLSGGLVVESNYVNVIAVSNQSLGTGDIAVNANATLSFQRTQDYTGAPRTPVVTLTTNSSVVGFTTTDTMTLPFGLVVQGGGKLTTESWRLGEIWSGAVTLSNNLTLAAVRASGSGTSIILSGLVSGPGGMVVNADDSYNGEQGVVELRRGTNTYAGGTTVSYGRLKVSADQALGTGPVTVYNTLIPSGQRTALLLDATPDMNWSLSNSIAGEGTIKVEDGSSYRLTESGTVSPGTNSAAVAVLTVNGKFAFAKSGATPATLAIDVATAGTLAGTNYDQLAVTTGDVALASSITNCTLVVTLVPTPVQMNGLTLTILSAPGADFTPYQFASVSGLGTGGSATYSNGAVYLTWTLATPVINNGAYSNLMATSCDVSGVLSSTGSAPATVRCYYGTNSAGTSGWAYTNYLGTQGVGTVSTSLTGLTSNVKYYYRFYATNDVGEYWSVATSNFTTLGDIYWNDAANGNWRANDANTWGAGLNVYPQNPLNDHVTNDSHVVSVTSATAIVAADVTLTTSVGATGTLSFVNAAAQSQNLILDGGRLGTYSDGGGAGDVVLNGNLRVKSASVLDPGAHGNRLNLANSTLNGNIEDYGAGTTGVLRVDGSLYGTLLGQASGRLLYNGISTNFTGGWLIDCAGDATSGYFWLGIEKDGGLGASTVTVTRGQINIDATQSSTAQRPAPARVIVNPAGRLLVGAGANPSVVAVTNWTVDLNGGHLRCYGPMKLAGGTVNVNADSAVWGWGYFGAGTKEFACQLTGTSALSFTYDNNGTGPFVLAGDNSGFSGSVRLLKDSLTVSHTNGLGTGPVLLASQTGGKLTLDRPGGSFDWTLANNLSGGCTNGSTAVALQVEDGAGTNTLTVLGTVDPGTNGVAGASNIVSLLRVDGSVAFGAGSRLKIDITGTNGVAGVHFDRLVVDHNLTGLGNATLEVNVSATLSNAAIRGLDVVVVSNATSFGSARFGSVQFTAPWAADVLYDNPPGTVRLMNFQDFRGTVFKFR